MSIQEQVKSDMVKSIKEREAEKTSILRFVMGEFSRKGNNLSDDEVTKVIRKVYLDAKEMNNQVEMNILNEYLPQTFDYDKTKEIVIKIISDNGFSTMQDMGKVMGQIKTHMCAQNIDGKIASGIVRELLK